MLKDAVGYFPRDGKMIHSLRRRSNNHISGILRTEVFFSLGSVKSPEEWMFDDSSSSATSVGLLFKELLVSCFLSVIPFIILSIVKLPIWAFQLVLPKRTCGGEMFPVQL